jgi:hypothetical protein
MPADADLDLVLDPTIHVTPAPDTPSGYFELTRQGQSYLLAFTRCGGIDDPPAHAISRLTTPDLAYLREAIDGAIGKRPEAAETVQWG